MSCNPSVAGGLAADSDQPMPRQQQALIAGYWQDVAARTGAQFNFDFWHKCQPRRSTYPACRAVLAARKQGAEGAMIDAIQRAYYLRAMNPSDLSTLSLVAAELKLDAEQFDDDLGSPEIEQTLQHDLTLRRQLGVRSFPSLVLACGDQYKPIEIDYHCHIPMLQTIERLSSA